jgi:uncharacterized protein (DUF1684 family)
MPDDAIKLRSNATSLLDWRRQVAALYARVRASDDPRAAHQLWQDERNRLLRSHPESPIPAGDRASFTGVPVAPYDPALRFTVAVDTDVEPARIESRTGADGVTPFERAGVAHVPGIGDLDVWWLASYGGGIFVPVKDPSSQTYGGGRYLLDTVKGADLGGTDDRLVLDFNFAYNPSCAYDPAWACPLAQPGNTVRISINAGELMRGK